MDDGILRAVDNTIAFLRNSGRVTADCRADPEVAEELRRIADNLDTTPAIWPAEPLADRAAEG